jgi:hypothetical protein
MTSIAPVGRSAVARWVALLFLVVPAVARAQKTYPAASCSVSDVQAAINSELAHPADGDIISIPAGPACVWTGPDTPPVKFTTSVTIQGAGAISATTGGASTTGTDQTIIIDHINNGAAHDHLVSWGSAVGKSLRVTGITFASDAGSFPGGTSAGMLTVSGASSAVRVDHCHFKLGNNGVWFSAASGVIDHNFFEATPGSLTTDIRFENGGGFASWADADKFGSSDFIFAEDNQILNGGISDGHDGARFVFRHNTMKASVTPSCPQAPGGNRSCSGLQMYDHGVTNAPAAGVRATEIYLNTSIQPVQAGAAGAGNPAFSTNSGTTMFWGNTVTQFRGALQFGYTCRSDSTSCNYQYVAPPNNWGHCGTAFGPSNWDGNTNASGYPCLMQPGRGKGDLLSGSVFPNILNSRTGTVAWPQQALVPVYVWNNAFTPSDGYGGSCAGRACVTASNMAAGLMTEDIDYYQQFGTYGKPGNFDGTSGVGQGSSLPSIAQPTCTPNANSPIAPGTTWLGVAVSGHWGPGYWNTTDNTLYVCTATNTWTAYYKPYTYPHPLVGGGSTSGTPPSPPTNLTATVH